MRTDTERLLGVVAARGDHATEVATRALVVAGTAHRGRLRKSREPSITHPVAVAAGLAELDADLDTIVAALLRDAPSDPDYPLTAIRAEFGDRVADLIANLERVDHGEAPPQIGDIDRRVLLITIADRLQDMQTIRFLEEASRQRTSDHTLQVVVPLARRLGLAGTADELTALATATLRRCASPHDFGTVDLKAPARRSAIRTASRLLRAIATDEDHRVGGRARRIR